MFLKISASLKIVFIISTITVLASIILRRIFIEKIIHQFETLSPEYRTKVETSHVKILKLYNLLIPLCIFMGGLLLLSYFFLTNYNLLWSSLILGACTLFCTEDLFFRKKCLKKLQASN